MTPCNQATHERDVHTATSCIPVPPERGHRCSGTSCGDVISSAASSVRPARTRLQALSGDVEGTMVGRVSCWNVRERQCCPSSALWARYDSHRHCLEVIDGAHVYFVRTHTPLRGPVAALQLRHKGQNPVRVMAWVPMQYCTILGLQLKRHCHREL
jgi:hypothetical protein